MRKVTNRATYANKRFWTGLILGLVGGAVLVRRRETAKRMPNAATFQRELAEEYGEVEAAIIMARVEKRYWELFAERPRFKSRALAGHLEGNILPGLALYQILQEGDIEKDNAYQQVDALMEAAFAPRARQVVGFLERLPNPFAIFRWSVRQVMRWMFPLEGWQVEWLEDSDQVIAFNLHSCFYLEVLRAYGAMELTPIFCRMDDLMFDPAPSFLSWERTRTQGHGDDFCDFRWRRIDN